MIAENKPIRRLLDQERGKFAWDCVQEIKKLSQADLQSEYRTRALTFNQMVQINGLGATLGFLKSKATKEQSGSQKSLTAYGYLLQHLTSWMRRRDFVKDNEFDALLRWVLEKASSDEYRRATTECLAFGDWLRRFAEAELEKEESEPSAESRQQGRGA
jgi:CRISPR-associated protein Cmr5